MYAIKLVPTSLRGGKIVVQYKRSTLQAAYIEKIGFFTFDFFGGYRFVAIDYNKLAFYLLLGASVSNTRLKRLLSAHERD